MASTGIYTTLLQNAGFTDQQWSREVSLQAEAENVIARHVTRYQVPQGSQLHIPKLSTFAAANTITRGAGGNEGQTNTNYTVIGDSSADVVPVTAVSKVLIPVTVEAEILNGNRAPIWEQALRTRMAQSLGKKEEITLLSEYVNAGASIGDANGYHCMIFAGAGLALGEWLGIRTKEDFISEKDSTSVNSYMDFGVKTIWGGYVVDYVVGATDPTWDGFLQALSTLASNNAPKPWTAVWHSSLYGKIFKVAEFWQASIMGDAGAAPARSGGPLAPLGVTFEFSTNVVNA